MSKLLMLGLILLLCVSSTNPATANSVSLEGDEEAVTQLVREFGRSLKMVPLLAPEDIVAKLMRQHYGNYVSPELLEEWITCPLKAPGRMVSSPWPDRIEVEELKKLSGQTYEVEGEIVEMTNTGETARKPVTLIVEKTDQSWLIKAVLLLPPRQ